MLNTDRKHSDASTGTCEVNMADVMQRDWRELCVAVTNETDPTTLTSLVQELVEALDRAERSWRCPAPPSDVMAAKRNTA
jgi:hypothetical protein